SARFWACELPQPARHRIAQSRQAAGDPGDLRRLAGELAPGPDPRGAVARRGGAPRHLPRQRAGQGQGRRLGPRCRRPGGRLGDRGGRARWGPRPALGAVRGGGRHRPAEPRHADPGGRGRAGFGSHGPVSVRGGSGLARRARGVGRGALRGHADRTPPGDGRVRVRPDLRPRGVGPDDGRARARGEGPDQPPRPGAPGPEGPARARAVGARRRPRRPGPRARLKRRARAAEASREMSVTPDREAPSAPPDGLARPPEARSKERVFLRLEVALERLRPPAVVAMGLLLVAVIWGADVLTGPRLAPSIFYLLPVTVVTWRLGRSPGLAIAIVSSAAWMSAELIGHVYGFASPIAFWNTVARFGVLVVVVVLLDTVHESLRREHELAVQEAAAAEQLREINDMKDTLLHAVSH